MRNITLQTLRDWGACAEGYSKIAEHVGEDEVIDLDLALRVLTVEDVVWALAHDPDKHRLLSFLADMIDLPGCEATTQTIRDYRDGRVTFEDLKKIATYIPRAAAYATTRAAARAAAYAAAYAATYPHRAASDAVHAAYVFVSIGDKPRLVNLIRSYYQ